MLTKDDFRDQSVHLLYPEGACDAHLTHPLPISLSEVTSFWLTAALADAFPDVRITRAERRETRSGTASSARFVLSYTIVRLIQTCRKPFTSKVDSTMSCAIASGPHLHRNVFTRKRKFHVFIDADDGDQ